MALYKAELTYFEIEADSEDDAAREVARRIREDGFTVYVCEDDESLDDVLHGHVFSAPAPAE